MTEQQRRVRMVSNNEISAKDVQPRINSKDSKHGKDLQQELVARMNN